MKETSPESYQEFQQIRNYLFLSISMFIVFVVLFESIRSLKAIYLKRRYLYTNELSINNNSVIHLLVLEDLRRVGEYQKHHQIIALDGYSQY